MTSPLRRYARHVTAKRTRHAAAIPRHNKRLFTVRPPRAPRRRAFDGRRHQSAVLRWQRCCAKREARYPSGCSLTVILSATRDAVGNRSANSDSVAAFGKLPTNRTFRLRYLSATEPQRARTLISARTRTGTRTPVGTGRRRHTQVDLSTHRSVVNHWSVTRSTYWSPQVVTDGRRTA